jgi:threonine synthase
MARPGLYARHAGYLPVPAGAVDLGQGATPTVRSRSIGPAAGIADLRFKLESLNPTGSYKDRFAGLAIGRLAAAGVGACVATSSGNTGAALAACAAAAGMPCALFVAEGAPAGKLAQMRAYGAHVHRVARFVADPAESRKIAAVLAAAAAARGLPLQVSAYAICPEAMEGIKTLAYELADEADGAGDVFLPVGGGGLFVAVARGYADLVAAGRLAGPPRLHAVQPEASRP